MRFSVPLYDKMIKNLYGGICRTTLQLICSPRHVSLPQESACFCGTMTVLAITIPFWDIVTEKTACFCGTMPKDGRDDRQSLDVTAYLRGATFKCGKSLPIYWRSSECSCPSPETHRQPQKIQYNPAVCPQNFRVIATESCQSQADLHYLFPYGVQGSFRTLGFSKDSMICIISAGVTINGSFGKCFILPVTRYESSEERATS